MAFFCFHQWKKSGRKRCGMQRYRCPKCKAVKYKKVYFNLFGAGHHWVKYRRRVKGVQQYRCTRCGELKEKTVNQSRCHHNFHSTRSLAAKHMMVCKKCGLRRRIEDGA